MYKLKLDNGKYTVILSDDCSTFKALRYGEPWQELAGNNLVLHLVLRIQELEKIVSQHTLLKGGE